MKKVKFGILGYGQRAPGLVSRIMSLGDKATVVGVCDLFPDRVDYAKNRIKEKYGVEVFGTSDPYSLIDNDEVNAVIIASAWESHIPLAIYAMKKGKAVGADVAGAYSVQQCWDLVNTYEQTKTPIMLLENCCYGRREMMLLNMAKSGFFGDIAHVEGSYEHDLRDEISNGIKIRHYRLRNYLNRNCENYPTHELGPLAKILDINHGNRFVSLSSFSSKAVGLEQYIKDEGREDVTDLRFNQGDIVTTIIKCAGGQTIDLKLITSLPTYGSFNLNIYGSKAAYKFDSDSFCTMGPGGKHPRWQDVQGNAEEYEKEWMHPVWKQYLEDGIQGGHSGMDYLCIRDFVDCLIEGKPMPIDVYDMASWMAVTALSEESVAKGGMPVSFPDFTNGSWIL